MGSVAVGIALAEAKRFGESQVLQIDGLWVPLAQQSLAKGYRSGAANDSVTDDAEYVVPVRWLASYPKEQAHWEKGMFATQNSACKLRQEFTLDRLAQHFRLDAAESGA